MDDAFERQRNSRKTPHQYCLRCSRFLEHAFGSDSSPEGHPEHRLVKHYNSFAELKEGLDYECHLCSILLAKNSIPEPAKPYDIIARISYSTQGYIHFRVSWHIRYDYKNNAQDSWYLGEVLHQGEVCLVTLCLTQTVLNLFWQGKSHLPPMRLMSAAGSSQMHQIVRYRSFATGYHLILSGAESRGWSKNALNPRRLGSRTSLWLHHWQPIPRNCLSEFCTSVLRMTPKQ